MLPEPLVHALVMAAQYYQVLLQRQFVGHRLAEHLAVGRGVYHLVVVALRLQFLYAVGQRLHSHHHSCTASVRVVVHAAVARQRIVVQVVEADLHQALLLCTTHYALLEEHIHHIGEQCQYVYSHNIVLCSYLTLSRLPICKTVVSLMPFSLQSFLTVVPLRAAILLSVSPLRTL